MGSFSRAWEGTSARVRACVRPLRPQAGFALMETLVAMMVLLTGALGSFLLIDVSNRADASARTREGATNLAREVVEDAHDVSFPQIGQAAWLQSPLQALAGGSGAVASPNSYTATTTVARRGTSYALSVSWCSVDDARDGYGAHAAGIRWCSDSSSTGSADGQPEDLKRVQVTVSWSQGGVAQPPLVQTATFSPSGRVVGPTLSSFTLTSPALSAPYVVTSSSTSTVTFQALSTGAADVKFAVDGVEQAAGVTNPSPGTWNLSWDISQLKDATYTITATPVDALGTRGAPQAIQVKLSRGASYVTAPANVTGGYNYIWQYWFSKVLGVELAWDASPQGNVTGYEVDRGATVVCGGKTSLATSCIDFNAPSTGTTAYTVRTWYTDAAGAAQSVTTSYSVTGPANAASSYALANTTTNKNAKCSSTTSIIGDLVSTFPTGTTDSIASVAYPTWCMAALPAGVTLSAGTVTVTLWNTNSSTTAQTEASYLVLNGTTSLGSCSYSVPAGTTTPTRYTCSFNVAARNFAAGDELALTSGASSTLRILYNSTGHQSTISVPLGAGVPVQTPNPPTGLTATANGNGTTTVAWTAATGTPAPDFYRIYRDGYDYTTRVDTADATSTTVATASAVNATTLTVASATGFAAGQYINVDTGANQDTMYVLSISGNTLTLYGGMPHAHSAGVPVTSRTVSWTDPSTGGVAHTYYVTTVSSTLTESTCPPNVTTNCGTPSVSG